MKGNKKIFGLILSLVICFTLGYGDSAQAAKSDNTLNVAFSKNIRTVDGLYSTIRELDIIGLLTDDPLFYVNPKTFKPEPLSAESFKFVEPTILDITLRKDVFFHDGSPLTTDDVIYTFDWILCDESKTKYSARFKRWLKKVEKTGEHSVRFILKKPYPMVFFDLSYYAKLRKKGVYHKSGKPDNKAQNYELNGTGPYRVVQVDAGKKLVLKRFAKYRLNGPKGSCEIETIVMRSIPDMGAQTAEILSGGVDWLYMVPNDVAENLGQSGKALQLKGNSMRIGFIVLDAMGRSGDKIFTDIRVRRAINHAIKREAIVKHLVKGTSRVINCACNPVQFGCTTEVTNYPYDPEMTKKLLKEAGASKVKFELWASREKAVVEAVAADLNEAGIDCKVRWVKGSTLSKARNKGQLKAYFYTWGSYSIPDVGAILPNLFSLDSTKNYCGDKEVADWVEAGTSTLDPRKRQENYHKALSKIADMAYYVPLYKFTMNYVVSPDLDFPVPEDGMPRLFMAKWK